MIGRNPERGQVTAGPEPDATWRRLTLQMTKASGKRLDIELLRPPVWLAERGATAGGTLRLSLPELGAEGPAKVVALNPCPPIESGEGQVITGRFMHEADGELLNLSLEGEAVPTGVTAEHAYWSVDRQIFVPVGELRDGEQLNTLAGLSRVAGRTSRSPETVYNLEVHGEHVYRVGTSGTLVHNDCHDYAKELLEKYPDGVFFKVKPTQTEWTGHLPGYPNNHPQGFPDRTSFLNHSFHLENGIFRDAAFPNGVPIETWINEYARLNNMDVSEVFDFLTISPYPPK